MKKSKKAAKVYRTTVDNVLLMLYVAVPIIFFGAYKVNDNMAGMVLSVFVLGIAGVLSHITRGTKMGTQAVYNLLTSLILLAYLCLIPFLWRLERGRLMVISLTTLLAVTLLLVFWDRIATWWYTR